MAATRRSALPAEHTIAPPPTDALLFRSEYGGILIDRRRTRPPCAVPQHIHRTPTFRLRPRGSGFRRPDFGESPASDQGVAPLACTSPPTFRTADMHDTTTIAPVRYRLLSRGPVGSTCRASTREREVHHRAPSTDQSGPGRTAHTRRASVHRDADVTPFRTRDGEPAARGWRVRTPGTCCRAGRCACVCTCA